MCLSGRVCVLFYLDLMHYWYAIVEILDAGENAFMFPSPSPPPSTFKVTMTNEKIPKMEYGVFDKFVNSLCIINNDHRCQVL